MMELRMMTDLETALPAVIEFNFDELKAALQDRLHHYNTLVVTEDAVQEGKADLAKLRKLKDALDTSRKDTKKKWNEPLAEYEGRVKELVALIDAPISSINEQVQKFEEQRRQQKYEEIQAIYDEQVPDTIRDIIPLKRILDQTWLNKGTSKKKITEAIETLVKRTNVDVAYLEASVDPRYITAVRAKYIETLDVDKAMDHRDALVAAEQAFQQREAQRAALQTPVQEAPPVAAQEPVREPAPAPSTEEKLYSLRLAFQLTMDQANALKRFLAEIGIQYTKITKEETQQWQ